MKEVENNLQIRNIKKIIENFPFNLMLTETNIRRKISNCRGNSFYLMDSKCLGNNGFISAVLIYDFKSLRFRIPDK